MKTKNLGKPEELKFDLFQDPPTQKDIDESVRKGLDYIKIRKRQLTNLTVVILISIFIYLAPLIFFAIVYLDINPIGSLMLITFCLGVYFPCLVYNRIRKQKSALVHYEYGIDNLKPASEGRLETIAAIVKENLHTTYLRAVAEQGRELTEAEACRIIDVFNYKKVIDSTSDRIRKIYHSIGTDLEVKQWIIPTLSEEKV